MKLGQFTQIRPAQTGNTLEKLKTHFVLAMPADREPFLKNLGDVPFSETQLAAHKYLRQKK